jgi:hypothetical protein
MIHLARGTSLFILLRELDGEVYLKMLQHPRMVYRREVESSRRLCVGTPEAQQR